MLGKRSMIFTAAMPMNQISKTLHFLKVNLYFREVHADLYMNAKLLNATKMFLTYVITTYIEFN